MRFIVDTMLGTLAKWMRILGYDVLYDPGFDDDEMLRLASSDDRIIISRDRELCSRKADSHLMVSQELEDQIFEITAEWPPDEGLVLTRCLACNAILGPAGRDEAEGKVPEGVLERHSEFWVCEGCGKVFWCGTHWEDMAEKARRIIACRNSPR